MIFDGYSFVVLGEPAPKGSMRAILMRGKPLLIPGGSKQNAKALRAWDKSVKDAVVELMHGTAPPFYVEKPLELHLLFKLVRAKSNHSTHPTVKPDIDKLTRAVLDSLTGLLYDDDSRIAVLQAQKQWARHDEQGCVITVRALPVEEAAQLALGVEELAFGV